MEAEAGIFPRNSQESACARRIVSCASALVAVDSNALARLLTVSSPLFGFSLLVAQAIRIFMDDVIDATGTVFMTCAAPE